MEQDNQTTTEITELEQVSEQQEALQVPESNDALNEFIAQSGEQDDQASAPTAKAEVEKMTVTAAKSLISNGLSGVLGFASHVAQADLSLTGAEIDDFAKDFAPAVVKYANSVGEMPPWLAGLMKYRVELIAAKGVIMLGVSLYFKYRAFKEQAELQRQAQELQREAQLKQMQQAAQQPMQEAA
ncbi:hypothetical protein EXU30_00045 [Shewanella maritima]|uniref:Uncharacterized protein n=1 Tax=Shewanella maritima TaxID=2520507 RepID=A0A411PD07_9GAMM|nr:hypothetical protein [Shewanella maritima]QBF81260.1 hypothetical protein EXU30_00045 [Shewanella maritima]